MPDPTYKTATLSAAERAHVEYSLQIYNWDRQSTATALGITLSQLGKLIKKHGLVEGSSSDSEPWLDSEPEDAEPPPAVIDPSDSPPATVLAVCPNCSAENEVVPDQAARCTECGWLVSEDKPSLVESDSPDA